ncbi:putative inorganic phosphate cotransporter isoform X2 [Schistocerca gregaria]|uniref:putative inorganic phosphate cotransporter isoform X2 n=1 Tax=Schistocerca gregaria TaxID=7010 RepID=UPI00211DB00B|nr:putative inorganic phosphate cotransporter isoform X2 [Schistocerca gregaria]
MRTPVSLEPLPLPAAVQLRVGEALKAAAANGGCGAAAGTGTGSAADADADDQQPPLPPDTKRWWKARYTLQLMGMLGVANLYALRVNLSVAIVTMVNLTALEIREAREGHHLNGYANTSTEDVCPGEIYEPSTVDSGEFLWNEERQGYMLAGFFYGYALGQLPGGILAERFGGKLVFGLGTFLTGVLTIVSPFAVWLHEDLFFAVRLLEGLAEGVTFPSIQYMISKWSPPGERSRFSIIFSGSYLGLSICLPVSGLLCDSNLAGGWPLAFYVFGAIALLWYVPWLALVYDSPADHPWISEEERRYIEASVGTDKMQGQRKRPPVPWCSVIKCPGVWACAMMHVGIGWNFFGQITYLPTYMATILRFPIRKNAALSALPYVVGGTASVLSSIILDVIIKKGLVTPLSGYKIFNGITGAGAALTLLLLPRAGCDRTVAVALLSLNGLCLGAQYAGNGSNLLALAPSFSGSLYGFSNTFANIAGILAPYAVGYLTNGNQTRGQWDIMFLISAGVGLVTFLLYLVLATDKEQPWNRPEEEDWCGSMEMISVSDSRDSGIL